MGVPAEVLHSLRILGLSSDATADDVRSAFRRLARTYHPDVAGRHYSRKFEQISNAYALLKDLRQEEFSHPRGDPHFSRSRETARPPKGNSKNDTGRRFSFRGVFGKPIAWYRKRQERIGAEKERLRREAEDARKKILLEREARIETIIKRGEQLIGDFTDRRQRGARGVDTQGLALRLMSDICQVRHLALGHLGELANRPEVFEALFNSLQKWDIDERTARMVSALPLNPGNHSKLARGLADRAAVIPDALRSYLFRR